MSTRSAAAPAKPLRVAMGPAPTITSHGPLSASFVAASPVALDEQQQEQLARFRDLLLGWNERINLTAITDPGEVERKLFLDALRMAPAIAASIGPVRSKAPKLIDIGTGAGFPGLPLAIAFPQINFFLLDATNKKVAFLKEIARDLRLKNVTTLHGRAEELGHERQFRERFELATARAVSSLPALIELAMPLLKAGGRAFFPKSAEIDQELEQGERAASMLGAQIASADILPNEQDEKVTRLVILDKIGPTPYRFPRRAGLPAREPLGGKGI